MDISWGIIGCGNVTEVKSGPAFYKVAGSRLVAVMRRNGEKAADYAKRHGVARWYDNAEHLLLDKEVTAVYIATPPSSHEAYVLRSIQAGKPVYVEKPMALDAIEAERMAAAARAAGVKITIAHYRRQQPLFLKIKALLKEKTIGRIQSVNLVFHQPHHPNMIAQTEEAWRLNPNVSGGGLFHDLAPHQLDLMLYYFGIPVEVSGRAFNAGGLYEVDDTVQAEMIFRDGIRFSGSWCFTSAEKRDHCEIHGTKGVMRFSVFAQQPLELITDGKEKTFSFDALPHVQQPMIEKVVAFFKGEAENPCTAEEGVEVMRMMDAITGKAVSY